MKVRYENSASSLSVPIILPVRRGQRDTCGLVMADLFDGGSAGTEVRGVHPLAVTAMMEIGIDIPGHMSKLIDEFFARGADIVVTVCNSAYKACPFFPWAKTFIHAEFSDPSARTGTPYECPAQFRQVRDAVIAWIDMMLAHEHMPEYG